MGGGEKKTTASSDRFFNYYSGFRLWGRNLMVSGCGLWGRYQTTRGAGCGVRGAGSYLVTRCFPSQCYFFLGGGSI